jgi:hypothetical protein
MAGNGGKVSWGHGGRQQSGRAVMDARPPCFLIYRRTVSSTGSWRSRSSRARSVSPST